MAFALGEQRDQHVRAGHLVAAGGLHVDCGALYHALEPSRGLRIAGAVGRQPGQVLVEEFRQIGAQLVQIHPAGAQHRCRVGVIRQTQEQMLQRRIFVTTLAG